MQISLLHIAWVSLRIMSRLEVFRAFSRRPRADYGQFVRPTVSTSFSPFAGNTDNTQTVRQAANAIRAGHDIKLV